jgi:hypothetical protein
MCSGFYTVTINILVLLVRTLVVSEAITSFGEVVAYILRLKMK